MLFDKMNYNSLHAMPFVKCYIEIIKCKVAMKPWKNTRLSVSGEPTLRKILK